MTLTGIYIFASEIFGSHENSYLHKVLTLISYATQLSQTSGANTAFSVAMVTVSACVNQPAAGFSEIPAQSSNGQSDNSVHPYTGLASCFFCDCTLDSLV